MLNILNLLSILSPLIVLINICEITLIFVLSSRFYFIMVHLLPSTFIYFFLFFFQCKYADLVNGLADQGVFQRGRAQGGGGGGAGQASSSSGVQSAAGKRWTTNAI